MEREGINLVPDDGFCFIILLHFKTEHFSEKDLVVKSSAIGIQSLLGLKALLQI